MSLYKHRINHKDVPATCHLCGKTSINSRGLKSHIRLVHCEPRFKCAVCGNLFRKPQPLREHMAIHAGITDLYSCSFCEKTFRSSANMYTHRKRNHPQEYAEQKALEAANIHL